LINHSIEEAISPPYHAAPGAQFVSCCNVYCQLSKKAARIVATLSRYSDPSMDYADTTLVVQRELSRIHGLEARRSVIHCGIFASDASSYPRAWLAVQEGGRHERREQTVRIE
jgi:hypothetical protein